MPLTALDVAKQLLYDGAKRKYNITPLKLQKLIYFCNLTHLSILGKPLFSENVLAWKYGPVVTSVYRNYKSFGRKAIREDLNCCRDNNLALISNFVIETFGTRNASNLVDISHADRVYKQARRKEDSIMYHDQNDAKKIIEKEMLVIIDKAAYASLIGKLCPRESANLPPYIDDYKNISEKEIAKIWGVSD